MQTNKRKIGDLVFKPSGLDPLVVNRCMVLWVTLTDHALSANYNSWKKLDEYNRGELYQIEYVVMEEWREWLHTMRYVEESLCDTREQAMEFVYERAKEVLGIDNVDENSNNQDTK